MYFFHDLLQKNVINRPDTPGEQGDKVIDITMKLPQLITYIKINMYYISYFLQVLMLFIFLTYKKVFIEVILDIYFYHSTLHTSELLILSTAMNKYRLENEQSLCKNLQSKTGKFNV